MEIPKNEKISAYSHGGAVPIMLIGTIILLYIARGNFNLQLVAFIYGLSAILLFTASFLYHARKSEENDTSIWRKLDHSAIFLLIAGTYTPMCYIYLDGAMKWGILIAQWSLVVLGIVFKIFFINAPRVIGTLIYLIMGWIAIIPFKTLIVAMPHNVLILLMAGAVSYTVGAIIYAIKKPDPVSNFFGFHEIFHIFVVLGAFFHLAMTVASVAIINGI